MESVGMDGAAECSSDRNRGHRTAARASRMLGKRQWLGPKTLLLQTFGEKISSGIAAAKVCGSSFTRQ
jgi:hypothetical protein